MKKFLRRFTDRNKLSYFMNIAFGLSLLVLTLQFQFVKTTISTPGAIIKLDHGYVTEPNQVIRIIEGLISLGLIALGIERLKHKEKRDGK